MEAFRKFVISEARANGVSFKFFPDGSALIFERVPGREFTCGWHRFYRYQRGWITESAKGSRDRRHFKLEEVSA